MGLLKKMNYEQMKAYISSNIGLCKRLYITENYTAREVAEILKIVYDSNFQKALFRTFGAKGMGLGGERKGSGNKKGWNKK